MKIVNVKFKGKQAKGFTVVNKLLWKAPPSWQLLCSKIQLAWMVRAIGVEIKIGSSKLQAQVEF
jgi:hypothetical protein